MWRFIGLVVFLALFLAACNKNAFEVTVSRCPAVAVVGDSGVYTRFLGQDEMVENIVFTATIQDLQISCQQGSSIEASVSFNIGVQKGLAGTEDTVTLPYFVAVLKDNNEIVSKQSFSVTYRFDQEGRASGQEIVNQYIPTIEQARRYNYEVLIGFELEAADYWFNIRR